MKRSLAVALAGLALSCGGGGGSSGDTTVQTTSPAIKTVEVLAYDGRTLFRYPQDNVFTDKLYVGLLCVYRNINTNFIGVSSPVSAYTFNWGSEISASPEGNMVIYVDENLITEKIKQTDSLCAAKTDFQNPSDWEYLGYIPVLVYRYRTVKYDDNSPYRYLMTLWNTDRSVIALEPVSTLAMPVFGFWTYENQKTSPFEYSTRLSKVLSFTGFSQYPDIKTEHDLKNFVDSVKANLGLPQDAVFDMFANKVAERELQSQGRTFYEYHYFNIQDTSDTYNERFQVYRVETSLTVPLKNYDICSDEDGNNFECVKLGQDSSDIAISAVYTSVNGMHVYIYNPNTGAYGHLRGVNIYQTEGLFTNPEAYGNWLKISEGEMVCEDTNIPYTVKCTAPFTLENPETGERVNVNISNYFVVPIYF